MANISLARLLKLKNRYVSRLAETASIVRLYNSRVVGTEEVDVRGTLEAHKLTLERLVTIKQLLEDANQGAQRSRILRISELKTMLGWLKELDTKSGKDTSGYHEREFVTEIDLEERQRMTRAIEEEIFQTQEEIDTYNATVKIPLPEGYEILPE